MELLLKTVAGDLDLCKQMMRYRLLIFFVVSVAYVLAYFHKGVSAVVGPEILKELALTPTSLGLISSAYFWGFAATAFPSGILSDTLGARKTLVVFVLIAGIGGFIFGGTYSIAMLTFGRFVIGFGSGVVFVAAMRILADWYKPDEMATYSGLLLAAGNIGAFVSTTPMVFLMDNLGWRNAFIAVGVITVLVCIACYIIVRNKPSELGFPPPREVMSAELVQENSNVSLFEATKVVLSEKRFYLLAVFIFSFYGTFMGFGSLWAGPYLLNVFGLSKEVAGNILMMFPLGMIIGCPLSGYFSDKIIKSRKGVLLYGCVLHSLCYIPLIFLTENMNNLALYILFFLYGLLGGTFVSCFACVKEIYDARFAGTANGALVVFVSTGGAFYQYVMAAVINCYPAISPGVYSLVAFKATLMVPLVGLLVGSIAFAFFREEPKVI